jgi:hypothetical protein
MCSCYMLCSIDKGLPVDWMTQQMKRKGKGKGKAVPVLFDNWPPHHEGVLGKWTYTSTHSLTPALDGGEWSVSRPGRFNPRERAPGTYWIGGWLDPRAVLDAVVKRKIPCPRWEPKIRTPIVQPVAQRYTDWAITALRSVRTSIKR